MAIQVWKFNHSQPDFLISFNFQLHELSLTQMRQRDSQYPMLVFFSFLEIRSLLL